MKNTILRGRRNLIDGILTDLELCGSLAISAAFGTLPDRGTVPLTTKRPCTATNDTPQGQNRCNVGEKAYFVKYLSLTHRFLSGQAQFSL